jgi:uncharacterized protein YjbI with pentapeptide repeats
MANPEHLAILKQGVEVWNKWRVKNSILYPDLSRGDLRKYNLSRINLWGANLKKADLQNAILSYADLRVSNLEEANLINTILFKANLRDADLREADLTGADLRESDFGETNLIGANMSSSIIGYTVFINLDFASVKGLESVIHEAPSTIGIDTFYRSQGNIPELFLRGCGIPDQMIKFAQNLSAITMCFISYSHKDEVFAKRIYDNLQKSGVRCWRYSENMKIGDKIRPTIDESIRLHDKLLLILSEHSVQSDWVEHEVEHALDRERNEKKSILFPVRLDEAVMDSTTGWAGNVKRQRYIGDFTRWKDHDAYKTAFDRLLRDLTAG